MSLSEVPEVDHTIIQPEQGGGEHRFRILKKVGAGGMGDVYLAEDTALRRNVAIKTIRPELCKVDEIRKRIERECVMHAKIGSHPHIVALYDRLEQNGQINLIMEFVEGEDLQVLLQKHADAGTRLPWRDGIRIATQTLDALSRIHAQGIVHRDIKPSNILVTRDDSGDLCAKLMDFGIARAQVEEDHMTALTREGTGGPGTPLYMAPEQIDPSTFGAISVATDVYAMGVMLYQIVSGHPPFTGSLTEIYNGHLNQQPPPMSDAGGRVPLAFVELLRKALAKKPKDRLPTARAFRDELVKLLDMADKGEGIDMGRTVPAAAIDPSRTVVATGAEQSSVPVASGSTVLDTGTNPRARKKKSGVLVALVLVAVVMLGALAAVAAGGYVIYNKYIASGGDGTADTETAAGTETADGIDTAAGTTLADPTADIPSTQADATDPVIDGAAIPPALPADSSLPTGLPTGSQTLPTTPDALAVTAQPDSPVDDSAGSAMDALMQRLSEPPAEPPPTQTTTVSKPATPPPAEPKPEPASPPKPTTVAKPEPEPEPDPPPKEDPPPADDGWTVIRKEDRKVD
jgi:eukaryotic-like serine/threonine-protein kinase